MFKDYIDYRPRRRRRRLSVHIPVVAVVAAGALLVSLFTRSGDARLHEDPEVAAGDAEVVLLSSLAPLPSADEPTTDAAAPDARHAAAAEGADETTPPADGSDTSPADEGTDHHTKVTAAPSAEDSVTETPWQEIEVAPGQTLSGVFDGLGLPPREWMALLKLERDASHRLKRLRAGDVLQVRSEGRRLSELRMEMDELRTLQVRRGPDGLDAVIETADVERRPAYAYGEIESSLFLSGKAAGLSDRLIMSLVDVLAYDIDFALDLREGDRFVVVYEELYRDGEKLRDGPIQAVEFQNGNRKVQAFRHEMADGRSGYYRADGEAVRTAFLRNPLDVFRISSHFNLKRRHPVLNTIRAHRGTDYAAPTGTPIRSTGEGKVVFAGTKGGFGRTVIVQHGSTYKSLYAHMSRIRVRSGATVRQGQVIGHVGSSGLATGPHLHYEFLVNGVHRNPLTVPLPRSQPIPKTEMAAFKSRAAELQRQIAAIDRTRTAHNDQPTVIATP